MRWPFVSRDAYNLAIAQVAYFQAKADQWEALYLAATKPVEKPALPEKVVDVVSRAIRDASGNNSALRGHLAHFARTERERGTSDEKIVAQIHEYANGAAPTDRAGAKADRDEANEALAEILG